MPALKNVLRTVGIDRSIAYTTAGQAISTVGGFVTALFILWCLSKEEMGYYYTFKSVMAIQVFFELGMNTVITQYAAHEMPHLQWDGYRLTGPERYQSRLASLLHFSAKWYVFFASVLFLTLSVGGYFFFAHYGQRYTGIDWQTPWFILCITTTLNLLLTPLFSYLQGLGKVKEVARYFFYKYIVYLVCVLVSFALGAKLYALSIGNISYVLVALFFLCFTSFGKILRGIWKTHISERIAYFKEIFPFQWKIAASWISGYFIFQLFKPVLYATDGAVAAGQMGITLEVLTGIQALTFSWTSTKIPTYSGYIETHQYAKLDSLFGRTLRQAVGVNGLLLIGFFLFLLAFQISGLHIAGVNFAERFLPLLPLVLMMIPEFLNQFITAWATYLRCHKQEPFLVNSIVTGVLCCLSTLVLGRTYGLQGITWGYCLITMAVTPWAYHTYITKKKLWHQN